MEEQLKSLEQKALTDIEGAPDSKALEEIRINYLGKKGGLTAILKTMGKLSAEERPVMGALANAVRETLTAAIEQKGSLLKAEEMQKRLAAETIDVTLPGMRRPIGKKHPLTQIIDDVTDIFLGMGYNVAEGPEVELDYYNFEALNMPPGHPARDTQDTFYIDPQTVLRTQTSSVQIRVMENQKPPIRIISPGRVYRSDTVDATHSAVFHQIEGLVVDKGVSMGMLKGTLEVIAKRLFGEETKIRLRPHHFPYTEPSCEVDISCFRCGGKGCPLCKYEGWIEILGAGMVHPAVLERCGIDTTVYSGFAFGVGVERLAMFRYEIDDLRLLYENDVRFLSQF
ncbi:MAG: phenylalanine--tRNA ligase subunit alpha [Oscillospiraceae bacterium]|jgi:phenylalanyl-tRNA synthetase alpha chain|nr:phenylalanine--tRNA ligase subunit alpha [Oscillospiraceae bacterium]